MLSRPSNAGLLPHDCGHTCSSLNTSTINSVSCLVFTEVNDEMSTLVHNSYIELTEALRINETHLLTFTNRTIVSTSFTIPHDDLIDVIVNDNIRCK